MAVSVERSKEVAKVKDGVIAPWFQAAKRANQSKQFAVEAASKKMVDQLTKPVSSNASLGEELAWIVFFGALAALPAMGQFLALSFACVEMKAAAIAGKLASSKIFGMKTFANFPKCEDFWIKYESISKTVNKTGGETPNKELLALGADFGRNAVSRLQQASQGISKDDRVQAAQSKADPVALDDVKDFIVTALENEAKLWDDQTNAWNLVVDDLIDRNEAAFHCGRRKMKVHVMPNHMGEAIAHLLGNPPGHVDRKILENQFEYDLWKAYIAAAVVVTDSTTLIPEPWPVSTQRIGSTSISGLRPEDIEYMKKFHGFTGTPDALVALGAKRVKQERVSVPRRRG